jgi:hypothetical protein
MPSSWFNQGLLRRCQTHQKHQNCHLLFLGEWAVNTEEVKESCQEEEQSDDVKKDSGNSYTRVSKWKRCLM